MLNNSSESEHPYLVPDLRRNAYSFSPLRIFIAGLLCIKYDFYYIEVGSFCAQFLESYLKWVLNAVERFVASVEIYNITFILQFVNMGYHINCFAYIKESFIPAINPT